MKPAELPSAPGSDPSVSKQDLAFLRRAIALAEEAKAEGRHPFAAIVVDEHGNLVSAKGNNSRPPAGDPTQHAELQAAADASRHLDTAQLERSTLYTSAEPCIMCSGAVYWTGLGRAVYGLSEDKLLTLTGDNPENPTLSIPCREVFARGQRWITVSGPLLEDEAAVAHIGFWR